MLCVVIVRNTFKAINVKELKVPKFIGQTISLLQVTYNQYHCWILRVLETYYCYWVVASKELKSSPKRAIQTTMNKHLKLQFKIFIYNNDLMGVTNGPWNENMKRNKNLFSFKFRMILWTSWIISKYRFIHITIYNVNVTRFLVNFIMMATSSIQSVASLPIVLIIPIEIDIRRCSTRLWFYWEKVRY